MGFPVAPRAIKNRDYTVLSR